MFGYWYPLGSQSGTRSTDCHLDIRVGPEGRTDLTHSAAGAGAACAGAGAGGGWIDGGTFWGAGGGGYDGGGHDGTMRGAICSLLRLFSIMSRDTGCLCALLRPNSTGSMGAASCTALPALATQVRICLLLTLIFFSGEIHLPCAQGS